MATYTPTLLSVDIYGYRTGLQIFELPVLNIDISSTDFTTNDFINVYSNDWTAFNFQGSSPMANVGGLIDTPLNVGDSDNIGVFKWTRSNNNSIEYYLNDSRWLTRTQSNNQFTFLMCLRTLDDVWLMIPSQASTSDAEIASSEEYPFWLWTSKIFGAGVTVNSNSLGCGAAIKAVDPYIKPSDPFFPGGESDTGGGEGNFDGTSVDVDFTSLPTLSAVDTGFISLYNPTLAQLQSLANYMWSELFDLDTFKKLFGDPMQAILGLSIVPGPVPSSGAQVVKVGNISTGISINKAASQYINIDCGTLNVEEFWGAYLDYEPYTKAEIYLPFIGVHQIAVDDIMNKPVHIMYHIDLLSGGCACEIKCGGSVLYTFIGSCAVSIPVTGSDWTNLINGVLSAASAIGTMVATGGATAPAAAGEIASAAVNSLKPSIEKSGSVAGAGGLLAGKVPVLILTRPRQALPGKQNTFTGYPAFITRSLGAISGYTEVHSIRLSGIDGTESEIDEIEELLKGGVIL